MRYKILAAALALTVMAWAQTATQTAPSTPQQSTAPAEKAKCPCCEKMGSADAKDMHASCMHHDMKAGDEAMGACCAGKDKDKEAMSCCGGKDGKSCMKGDKDEASACSGDKCGKDKMAEAGCCAGMAKDGKNSCGRAESKSESVAN